MSVKQQDYPELKCKALALLPTTQAELGKTLGIPTQLTSELVKAMLKDSIITRTRVRIGTINTFLLSLNGKPKFPSFFATSPCLGCTCEPEQVNTCAKLYDWLQKPILV